jgi:hypothetical protein
MRNEYHETYRELSNLYCQNVCLNESNLIKYKSDSVSLIEKVIDGVVSELNIEKYLRPDARHFLLINLHQMILIPLINSGNNEYLNLDNILYMIGEDTKSILYSAKNLAGHKKEISGVKVLKAVSLCYDSLYLSGEKIKIWGP